MLSQLTGDRKLLRAAIENLGSSNGTPFYDALRRELPMKYFMNHRAKKCADGAR